MSQIWIHKTYHNRIHHKGAFGHRDLFSDILHNVTVVGDEYMHPEGSLKGVYVHLGKAVHALTRAILQVRNANDLASRLKLYSGVLQV